MAEISASLVRDLREKTGAGMMDCKKALTESGGDIEAAIDWLRKKGLSQAAKKAGRTAAEGLVAIALADRSGAMVELNAETDFVARNDGFQAAAKTLAELALAGSGQMEDLLQTPYPGTERVVSEEITNLVATIGENMNLRRCGKLSVSEGVVASYVHNALAPNLGKIGILVALQSSADADKLMALGKSIAMHIAAARPEFLSIDDVDPTALARERDVLSEQARASGKPEAIIAKMVEGRLRKYYEEVVLLEQVSMLDQETRIKGMVEAAGKELGAPVAVTGFLRFQLGEGIDKGDGGDFAAEVAAAAGKTPA